ncbi:methylenetetrahydrofolate reductase [Sphingobium sp. B2]|uniref:methylenetetrahydrofolate reductase n=1 Tax=Sphingobium sp. B2 TaxID=2583228 RepID=UPI0021BD9EB9|nr:methylenetetrahydrofolate reductase [Sphingobium sp. B2]
MDHISPRSLTQFFSLEMTARDVGALREAAPLIPQGTRLSITFLPGEEMPARVAAAAAARELGFIPVPHISARRIASKTDLETYLDALIDQAQVEDVFLIAGDPPEPLGPYEDSLGIIRSGVLSRYGISHVGIAGHPEGHGQVGPQMLRQAMLDKKSELEAQGIGYAIMTQFGFDADPVLEWLAQIRSDGIRAPVRLGVPGPASIKRLLSFAARCGVGTSTSVLKKYGISITKLLGTAGLDRFVNGLAEGLRLDIHGEVALHLYPFGGLRATAEWADSFVRTGRG